MRTSLRAVAAFLVLFTTSAAISGAQTLDNTVTSRVSFGTYTGAVEATNDSTNARVSRNGRFVVFESTATNLVSPSTTINRSHIYLLDRQAGTVELISKNISGGEGAADSTNPTVSDDGRYVAFASSAAINTFTTVCFSEAFCDVNKSYGGTHIFVRDRLANETKLASQVSLPSKVFDFNEDGELQIEEFPASSGLFRPKRKEVTKRIAARIVGVGNATSANPVITGDGRFIAFDTDANNLEGVVEPITYPGLVAGVDYNSATGALLVPADTIYEATSTYTDGNGVRDIYVRDGKDFTSQRMSLGCKYHAPAGCAVEGDSDSILPGISDDGLQVTFQTLTQFIDLDFNNAIDIYMVKRSSLHGEVAELSRVSNNTSRILSANGDSTDVSINGDGRFVAFSSSATDLVSSDTNSKADVFVYDTKFFKMARCVLADGTQANQDVLVPRIAGNGEYVVMHSAATNWGATSGNSNIYLGTLSRATNGSLSACTVTLASVGIGFGGDGNSTNSGVGLVPRTVNGTLTQVPAVVYQSLATNLHSGTADANGQSDIFQAPSCTSTDLATDTDGDGTSSCFDQCPNDPLKVEDDDTDGDGSPNCADACSSDALKTQAGVCGCGVADTDSDSDGTADCKDTCPNDAAKTSPGSCGCGFVDADSNGNGVVDCNEVATGTPVPGATPTVAPTSTPNTSVGTFVPAKAVVTRNSNSNFQVDMSGSGASFAISKYIVQLFMVQSGKTKYLREISSTSPQLSLTLKNKGTYRVKYAVQTSSGSTSKLSTFSSSFKRR